MMKGSSKIAKYRRMMQNKLANTESTGGLSMYIFAKKKMLQVITTTSERNCHFETLDLEPQMFAKLSSYMIISKLFINS